MKLPLLLTCFFLALFLAPNGLDAQTASGSLFTVNTISDSSDSSAGDGICADAKGQCTLRAAIQESNSNPASIDVIMFDLPDPSTIELVGGELEIEGPTQIVGQGTRRLTLARSSAPGTTNFRIFHVANGAGNIDIRRMKVFNGNAGDQNGGGIYVEQGSSANLTEIAFTSNAAAGGGAIASSGRITITHSLINGNSAAANGGAILNLGGSLTVPATITDSTITDNSAAAGGAIYNTGNLVLANATIAKNAASDAARSIFNDVAGSITTLNTIIGNDDPATATSLNGAFVSAGNNIVTDARGSSGFTNGVNGDQVSDNNLIDPLLGNLANNGGQTDTRALLKGSPAINAGNGCIRASNCAGFPRIGLNSDQRTGYPRQFGTAVDIGAFEAGSSSGGTVGIGLGFASFGRSNRYGGSIAVLINSTTGERQYTSINPFGNFRLQNVGRQIYILNIQAKRFGVRSGPSLLIFDDIALFNVPFKVSSDLTVEITKTGSQDSPK